MAKRTLVPARGFLRRGVVVLHNRVVLGASGAISSQDPVRQAGCTVVKTATKVGRYTVTLDDSAYRLLWADARVIGATDAAYTTANGLNCFLRNDAVGTAGARTFDIQLARTDTGADAEAINSAVLLIRIEVTQSKV